MMVRKAWHLVKRSWHSWYGCGLILYYHRVAELTADPFQQAVTPANFAAQMEILHRHARPMSLRQLAFAARDGRIPRRAVVVTFDDGYADNCHQGKPILERFGIPATVFVAAGYVGGHREYWWDELEQLILETRNLPAMLDVEIRGERCPDALEMTADTSTSTEWRLTAWKMRDGPQCGRHRVVCWLHSRLARLPEVEREKALHELRHWAGVHRTVRPSHAPMTDRELITLGSGGLVDVGGHTVGHSMLSALPAEQQRTEIVACRFRLAEIIGRHPATFSYPFGDYMPETLDMVRDAGFECACRIGGGAVHRHKPIYGLPRMWAQNWGGEEFARQLARWFSEWN